MIYVSKNYTGQFTKVVSGIDHFEPLAIKVGTTLVCMYMHTYVYQIFCRIFSNRESGAVHWPEVFVVGEQWNREAGES